LGAELPARSAFLAGVAAAGLATLASLSGRYLLGLVSVPELVANLLTAALPGFVFNTLLVAVRYAGRPLLLVSISLGLLLAGGVAALPLRRALTASRPALPPLHPLAAQQVMGGASWGALLLLGVLPGLLLSPLLTSFSGLSVVSPTAAWLVIQTTLYTGTCLRMLGRSLVPGAAGLAPGGRVSVSRRLFLENLGLAAAAVVVGTAVLRGFGDLAKQYLARTPTGRVGPSGSLSAPITSNDGFYVVSKNVLGDPDLDTGSWRLEVTGATRLLLDHGSLLRLKDARQYQTLECISNEVGGDLISTALWDGVQVRTLLDRAGVRRGDRHVLFRAADGYSDSLPLDVARDPTTIVALLMNGSVLPKAHGFPARLLIPGRYGMKNVKWLTTIELASDDHDGYWEQRGWSKDAQVKTMARFDTPSIDRRHAERPIQLGGIAYGGRRGISRVEVDIQSDAQGHWVAARLSPPLSPFTWVIWSMEWDPVRKGRHRLRVRAVDGAGGLQQGHSEPPLPTGAAGYHQLELEVI
jgi:DMSO/TMAO reductase YedYZ molybdopterin-dependent catalytic subunit